MADLRHAQVDDIPHLLHALDDSDWSYYVRDDGGDPSEELWVVDDPAELEWERLHLAPVAASSLEPEELELDERVTRDGRGRFAPLFVWMECRPETNGAVAFYGVRYKRRRREA